MTYDEIMNRMLERVPDTIDKREGSIIFDALSPCAHELVQLYDYHNWLINQTFIDTADREHLVLKGRERGLEPYAAKATIAEAKVTPNTVTIDKGARFTCNGLTYAVTSFSATPGRFYVTCEDTTTDANTNAGAMIPLEHIEGLESAEIISIYQPAEVEEDTEKFRQRYLDSFTQFAFGGNKADYIAKINDVAGVGGVKVYPAWNGGGTVKIVFIDSAYGAPTTTLVAEIQGKIDPFSAGMGVGIAPIGHKVTVVGATITNIIVDASITYEPGYVYADVKSAIDAKINDYFLKLSKEWQDNLNSIVRISEIYSLLLGVPRVIDVQNVRVNNATTNLVVPENSIPRGAYRHASG